MFSVALVATVPAIATYLANLAFGAAFDPGSAAGSSAPEQLPLCFVRTARRIVSTRPSNGQFTAKSVTSKCELVHNLEAHSSVTSRNQSRVVGAPGFAVVSVPDAMGRTGNVAQSGRA